MNSTDKPIFIAGTRLTGEVPHIGTYYGWIKQIRDASKEYNVIILIADYQSLDIQPIKTYKQMAENLKATMQYFLPEIPVVIESEIKGILPLAFNIAKIIKERYYRRIQPIKKRLDDYGDIPFSTLMYPALMIADILALSGSAIFDKPEGKFQHVEVLNDIIEDLNRYFKLNIAKLRTFPKKKVNILSLDGTGPMKRVRSEHGLIEVYDMSKEKLKNQLLSIHKLNATGNEQAVIKSIQETVLPDINLPAGDLLIDLLTDKIYEDLNYQKTELYNNYEHLMSDINNRVIRFNQLLGEK